MTVGGNVGVADAIVFHIKDDAPYSAIVDQMPVMLLARHSQALLVIVGNAVRVGGFVFKRGETQLAALQPFHRKSTRAFEMVNRKPWEHSVSNIESLRYRIEREGDQGPIGCSPFLFMLQSSFQKFTPDAAALMTGRHEQLRKKP